MATVVATATAVSGAPSGADELLPTLRTEELENGVYQVVGDGTRDMPTEPGWRVEAGPDGSVWMLSEDRAFRVGHQQTLVWTSEEWGSNLVGLRGTADGRLQGWAWDSDGKYGVASVDDSGAEPSIVPVGEGLFPFAFWPERAAWATRPEDSEWSSYTLMRFNGDSWQEVAVGPPAAGMSISSDGQIWAGLSGGPFDEALLYRLDGQTWTQVETPERVPRDGWMLGPEGSLWAWGNYRIDYPDHAFLARLKDDEWTLWEREELPPFGDMHEESGTAVAPDGALWVAEPVWRATARNGLVKRCNGVTRFDGATLTTFLSDHCVETMNIGPDGSVWLRANPTGPKGQRSDSEPFGTYVVTAEAVAAG